MRIAAIAERRGNAAAIRDEAADQIVDLAGRHARHHVRHDHVECFRRQLPGGKHPVEGGAPVKLDRAGPARRRVGGDGYVIGHATSAI